MLSHQLERTKTYPGTIIRAKNVYQRILLKALLSDLVQVSIKERNYRKLVDKNESFWKQNLMCNVSIVSKMGNKQTGTGPSSIHKA